MPAFAKTIAMPPPIVPAPSTATRRTGSVGVSAAMSGIFAAWRSAKKMCRRAADSVDATASSKSSRSRFRSRVERELDGGLDGLDAAHGRSPAARPGRRVLRGLLEEARSELRLVDVRGEVANSRKRARRRDPLGEGDGAGQQVALDDLVDQPEALGLRGAHGLAAHDHLQRLGHADEARQPLRPAGARAGCRA